MKFKLITLVILITVSFIPSLFPTNTFSVRYDDKFDFVYISQSSDYSYLTGILNSRNELMFSLSTFNSNMSLTLGDVWISFGRGLVFGDTRYNYLTKFMYLYPLQTNGILSFNYDRSDRNFDGIQDIMKGFCFGLKSWIAISPFILFSQGLSNYILGGILGLEDAYLLVGSWGNFFVSANYKARNLLGLGFVGDVEISSVISDKINLAFASLFEWYYSKFEFSLESRISTDEFYSPFSSSFFSRKYVRKGLIFSSRLNDENLKFSYINKVILDSEDTRSKERGIESEFYIFGAYNIYRFSFLDVEAYNDISQKKMFLSLYPYISINELGFYAKPLVSINSNLSVESIELSFHIKSKTLKFNTTTYVPLNHSETFIFYSTTFRDVFKENIDIKLANSDGVTLAFELEVNYNILEFGGIIIFSQKQKQRIFCVLTFKF